MSLTKIVHKKLKKFDGYDVDGLAFKEDKIVHIDERLKSKPYFLTVVHELLHIHMPELSETKVERISRKITNDLWKMKFRRIDD